ncbi:HEPN_RiboL-PSP domain-containing protein [Gammaproteobacteria bacterium]
MNSALQQFRTNLLRARELGTLALAMAKITTSAIDVSDMWRAQIVLGVSALDYLIHELTRIGMIEISKGSRLKTDSFSKFKLPLDAIEHGFNGQPHEMWLGETVREMHSSFSFQQPDKIADAIRLISHAKLWDEVGKELSMPAKEVKLRLGLIVDRRNKIAHESDMDPTNPGFRWPISETMANDSLDFIERIAEAICKIVILCP